ncbi:MAG TPA: hypothetical protein VHV77_04205 [Pirellulales bacterium]|nr:hypothetical protein [Pirellulales bacterium]
MQNFKICCGATALAATLVGALVTAAPLPKTSTETQIPQSIADFRLVIQSKDANAILAEATSRFGPHHRDPGSGVSMPSWDIEGGTLTCHPLSGPTYDTRNGQVVWLLQTKNPVSSNISGKYEMTTLPDPANHGNCNWIGVLNLNEGTTYRWDDANNGLRKGDQSRNFFISHPDGNATIEYMTGITKDTLLEDAGRGTIAHIDFRATTGETFRCALVSSSGSRMLSLEAPGMPCQLYRYWKQHWPSKP